MNIRKNIDYKDMYEALDCAMASEMGQMDRYCAIGKAVSLRPEKGAAVAAAKYLAERYPYAHGFSPRNVRRMRDFYRTYENHPALLPLALQIGWTQNVVILEADLSMDLREWYLWAAKQFGWAKTELTEKIAANAHENTVLVSIDEIYNHYDVDQENKLTCCNEKAFGIAKKLWCLVQKYRHQWQHKKRGWRRRRPVLGKIHIWRFKMKLSRSPLQWILIEANI